FPQNCPYDYHQRFPSTTNRVGGMLPEDHLSTYRYGLGRWGISQCYLVRSFGMRIYRVYIIKHLIIRDTSPPSAAGNGGSIVLQSYSKGFQRKYSSGEVG